MTKFYAQEKRVFDINKVTVVGSPTITSDGVASGFGASNYIETIKPNFTNEKTFKVECIVTINKEITSSNYVWAIDNYSVYLAFGATTKKFDFNCGGVVATAPKVIETDKTYKIVCEYNGAKNIIYVNEINDTNVYIGEKDNLNTFSYPNILRIGKNGLGSSFVVGSIDLTAFKIYVDGELVFQPVKPTYLLERRKEGFDLSKFTVVGSPTITSDGVASGFSSGNYVALPISLSNANSWKIILKNNSLYGDGYLFGGNLLNSIAYFKGSFWISSNGTSWDVASSVGTRTNIPANSLIQLEFTGTKYVAKYSVDNGSSWVVTGELASNVKITSNFNTLFIGKIINGTPANCSIDLSQFSITVDGKEVFTGAKEKYYAMRGM